MATKKATTTVKAPGFKEPVITIKPNTPEMAAYLEVGYGMSLEKVQTILKEQPERPELWPYEVYEKAQAFMQAYTSSPEPISDRPAWKLTPHPER